MNILNLFKKKEKEIERKIFKYNEDDILEILTEYLAEVNGFKTFNSKAIIIGNQGKDLRLLAIIDDEDSNLNEINLLELDKKIDFNGDHSFLEANEQYNLDNFKKYKL